MLLLTTLIIQKCTSTIQVNCKNIQELLIRYEFRQPPTEIKLHGCIFDQKISPKPEELIEFEATDPESVEFVLFQNSYENSVPDDIYSTFPNIQALGVLHTETQNKSNVLSRLIFEKAQKLKYLKINFNKITKLNENTFEGAENLEYIDLRENRIEIIHKEVFSGVTKLIALHLENNNIKELRGSTFSMLVALEIVHLEGNVCIDKLFSKVDESLQILQTEVEDCCKNLPVVNLDPVKDLEITRTHEEVENMMIMIKDLNFEILDIKEQLETCRNQKFDMHAITENRKQLDSKTIEKSKKLKQHAQENKEKLNNLKVNLSDAKQIIQNCDQGTFEQTKKYKQLNDELSTIKAEIQGCRNNSDLNKRLKDNCDTALLAKTKNQCKEDAQGCQKLKSNNVNLSRKVSQLQKNNKMLTKEISDLKKKNKELTKKISQCESENQNLVTQLSEYEGNAQEIKRLIE